MSYFSSHPGGGAVPLPTAQERADAIMAAARAQAPAPRPLFRPPPPRPDPLPETDDLISCRLAEEVEYVQRILDNLGVELVGDPACVMRHQSGLQNFDLVNQILGHLARVLRTSAREEAISRIGMAELKARLTR